MLLRAVCGRGNGRLQGAPTIRRRERRFVILIAVPRLLGLAAWAALEPPLQLLNNRTSGRAPARRPYD